MILMSVFGVVSRLAYAAWPNCDSSPRVPVALRGGKSGSLAWEVDPWDACCCRLKFFVCVRGSSCCFHLPSSACSTSFHQMSAVSGFSADNL